MRLKPLLPILAMLAVASCQKSEITPSLQDRDASARIGATTTTDECDVLDFENAATSTTTGDHTYTSQKGVNIVVRSNNYTTNIFNTASPHPEDLSLGSTNEAFGGPGVGAGGASGPFANDVPLGNILIIQEFSYPLSEPNADDSPDLAFSTNQLGLVFPSDNLANTTSIQVIDVDADEQPGSIFLLGAGGNVIATYPIPATGANGVATIPIPGENVRTVLLQFKGEMGFDNLRFCPTTPPIPTEGGCVRTQGYYKNYPDMWAVQSLTIGGTSYSKAQLLQVLKTPPQKGNAVLILSHQLIAAKLNLANNAGASPEVQAAIAKADQLLQGINITSGYSKLDEMKKVAATLDKYNNGLLGNGHCD